MARKRSRKERWDHKTYNIGFCYNRDGVVYTNIAGLRKSTHLKWLKSNRSEALEILDFRVQKYFNGETASIEEETVFGYTFKFLERHSSTKDKDFHRKVKNAVSHFFKKDYMLSDIAGIRDELYTNIGSTTYNTNTLRRALRYISQIFNSAIQEELISKNPVLKNMYPKEVKANRPAFGKDDILKLHDYFMGKNDVEVAFLIKFLMITGLRVGEAINIKKSDIHPTYIQIHGKGGIDRQFPTSEDLFPELKPLIEALLAFNTIGNKLFSWTTYAKVGLRLRLACVALEIYTEGQAFHAIRKYAENSMIDDSRFDIRIVAELLGHSIRIQEKHYLQRLGADKIAKLLKERI
jgi:integrase